MKGTINLRNQIMIDGKKIAELTYDTEKITPELYLKALNYTVAKGNGVTGANIKIPNTTSQTWNVSRAATSTSS